MDEIGNQILAILDRPTGIGIFSRTVDLPGKGRTRHWFSLASGMASLQAKIEYRTRFKTFPEWVSLYHPDHQIWLCRLSVQSKQPLPPGSPALHGAKADDGEGRATN